MTNYNKPNVVCIIQARLGSTRLSEKVCKKINGTTILDRVINSIKKAKTSRQHCYSIK